MKILFIAAMICFTLMSGSAFATPYILLDTGLTLDSHEQSLGVELGGTQVINDCIPLVIGITGIFRDNSLPSSDAMSMNYMISERHDVRRGLENGVMVKTGYTIKNISLHVGAGLARQEYTSTVQGVFGTNDENNREKAYLQTYAGILYRFDVLGLSVGYDSRRGIILGIAGFIK